MKKPLVSLERVTLPPPSPSDKRADWERFKDALGTEDLTISTDLLRKLPGLLRKQGFQLNTMISHFPPREVISLQPENAYVIALDIGSTNITGSLLDLKTGNRSERITLRNPQTEDGTDILTRIHLASSGMGDSLSEKLIRGINLLISDLSAMAGIDNLNIHAMAVSANTVMSHFLLNLPVENLPVEPYVPVAHRFPSLHASDLGLTINPHGLIYIFPNAGSYVGGDIISGIIASGVHRGERPSVLIDVGTNAEIVIGTKDWLLAGAGAAGPALEDGIFRAGRQAGKGSIRRIEYIPSERIFRYETIDGDNPTGICGSGVVDLVYELYHNGLIDRRGRFTESAGTFDLQGEPALEIVRDAGIHVTEREIENFLRSKAGMFTALSVLVHSVGLGFQDIERFYISGALGTGIPLKKAIALGMLPDLPVERFLLLGNTALSGAEMLLQDASLIEEVEEVLGKITYMEMNTSAEFMQDFPSARYIPHADPEKLRD